MWIFGGEHLLRFYELGGLGFVNCTCFLLGLPNSRLCGLRRFGPGLLSPGSLPGGGHLRLLRRTVVLLRRWIWDGVVKTLTTRHICSAEDPAC